MALAGESEKLGHLSAVLELTGECLRVSGLHRPVGVSGHEEHRRTDRIGMAKGRHLPQDPPASRPRRRYRGTLPTCAFPSGENVFSSTIASVSTTPFRTTPARAGDVATDHRGQDAEPAEAVPQDREAGPVPMTFPHRPVGRIFDVLLNLSRELPYRGLPESVSVPRRSPGS